VAAILLTAIAAAGLALAQPLQASPPPAFLPDADPALWVAQDADTTVYLFGTFHTLDGRSAWFNDEVHAAFSASDELILETLLPAPGQSLAREDSMRRNGTAPTASFVGATRMAVRAARTRGLDVSKGADMVLRSAAERSGKAVYGLETVEFQLNMLQRMSGAPRSSTSPIRTAGHGELKVADLMAQMQSSWNNGDQRVFVNLLERMRQSTPHDYQLMFPDRNDQWADWVVSRMERPGTIFVAVGAGHFAGPDSVLAKLSSKGVTATRLN
jgi:uncharacterized protein YbaP (TraB family)